MGALARAPWWRGGSWLLVFVVAYHFLKSECAAISSRFHISSHLPARGLKFLRLKGGWETLHMCCKLAPCTSPYDTSLPVKSHYRHGFPSCNYLIPGHATYLLSSSSAHAVFLAPGIKNDCPSLEFPREMDDDRSSRIFHALLILSTRSFPPHRLYFYPEYMTVIAAGL